MASVLSLRPQSPFKRSFSDNPYLRSCSPLKDNTNGVLRALTSRNASACSIHTLGAISPADWLSGGENTPPPLTSRSLLDLGVERQRYGADTGYIDDAPRKRSCGINRHPPSLSQLQVEVGGPSPPLSKKRKEPARFNPACIDHPEPDVLMDDVDCDDDDHDDSELFDLYDAIHVPLPEGRQSDNPPDQPYAELEAPLPELEATPPAFRRWMSTLRKRHMHRQKWTNFRTPNDLGYDSADANASTAPPLLHVQGPDSLCYSESMTSSMGCVTAIRSASMTQASASIAHHSDMAGLNTKGRFGKRSSTFSEVRKSTDSNAGSLGPILDESAWLRSVERRKIIEEIISSEESYINDLKVLINDYFTILSSVPAVSTQTRASIQHNICQILQLHQDLLNELHQVVPHADFTGSVAQQELHPAKKAKHVRFHSADMMPGRSAEHRFTRRLRHSLEIGRSPDRRPRALATDAKTAGDVAKVFNKHMRRFFTYEEYGAHWTTMSQDLTTMCKGFQGWQEYERGVEALSKLVASENNRESSSRKALGFSDLLIKPIQRVCKYPLMFDDLCRQTPVCDDPEAHAELEKSLFRLQETIREVNKAKDDPKTRRLIEISWQLQDRLTFQEQALSRALVFRLLGHVLVCGVLHVAYQTPEQRVKGQYMVCVLYKSCLVLATTTRFFSPYNVVASISLANGSVEEPDNGRGLQCHTAPYTWKLVFEHGHRLNEVILSACSSQEEDVWKAQLRERIACETHDFVEGQATMQDMFSSLALDIKSIGPVFGHADSLVRRMSVHRAATLGSKTTMAQVIIKNTQAQKLADPPAPFAPNLVTRSQSHMSANHVPTLAPRRAERIRLETALEDVWTKDILPFPGMSNRRVENHIRASANSVMRKLSMASIASNFSRRSPSFSSISNTRSEESFGSRVHKMSQGNARSRSAAERRPAPAVVDFQNAPAAFLPTDFELQDTRPCSRRRRLANRAVGTERWTERSGDKNTPAKPKRTRRLSTQLISLPRTDASCRVDSRTVSAASNTTLLHMSSEATIHAGLHENEKHRNRDLRGSPSTRASSADMPSKKFLKSKSRIFKFWM